MQILQTSFIPSQFPHTLSSSNSTTTNQLSLLPKFSSLCLTHHTPPPSLFIRCGGGPRTYPGGVSKWQWKRMQSKKSKQLLKARLARERSIYEMRKRAELKAAVSNLERPWEIVKTDGPTQSSSLFSVSADEQLKVLADRFQKPGGFDLWSDNDGPQVFNTREDLPSSRFFPKGVVHSVKPYGNQGKIDARANPNRRRRSSVENSQLKDGNRRRLSGEKSQFKDGNRRSLSVEGSESKGKNATRLSVENLKFKDGNWNDKEVRGDSRRINDGKRGQNSNGGAGEGIGRKLGRSDKNKRFVKLRELNGEHVFDMSLQGDGSYGFSGTNNDDKINQGYDYDF